MAEEKSEEKKELLKRTDIRTMQKDIKRLQEAEADKEIQKISELKTENKKDESPQKKEITMETGKGAFLIPKAARAPVWMKYLIRFLILAVVFGAIGFELWSYQLKNPQSIKPVKDKIILLKSSAGKKFTEFIVSIQIEIKKWLPKKTEETVPLKKAETPIAPPESAPKEKEQSMFPLLPSETLEIKTLKDLPASLIEILGKKFNDEQLRWITIKSDGKNIGLKEFFEAYQINSPENFYEKLDNNFELLLYTPSDGQNRVGFIARTKDKKGLEELMTDWESGIKNSFEPFFTSLTGEKPLVYHEFRNKNYKEVNFRYISFYLKNLGICYGFSNDYFLFMTSGEGMQKLIDLVIAQ